MGKSLPPGNHGCLPPNCGGAAEAEFMPTWRRSMMASVEAELRGVPSMFSVDYRAFWGVIVTDLMFHPSI
jgi:hypothetical protein